MFGLGWIELLVIAGVISLLAGPSALRKVMQMAQEVNQVKSDFTGPGALKRLLDADPRDEQPEPTETDAVEQEPRSIE